MHNEGPRRKTRSLILKMKRLLPYGAWIALLICLLIFSTAKGDERNQVHLTIVNHTASGYVKQGCVGLTFVTSAGFTGTLAGSFAPASSTTYPIPIPSGATMGDVYYTVSAGTLTSIEVR
jgi:hypothetical protein